MENNRTIKSALISVFSKDGIDELVEAINNHIFDNVELNRNFHGNYEINLKELNG